MKHTVRQELAFILLVIGAIWLVFGVSLIPALDLNRFGVTPRTLGGLPGIVAMPFLHHSFGHLSGNTVPLFVLMALLAGSRADSRLVLGLITLLSGSLLWLFAFQGNATHIGASGVIYGLTAFLIMAGILERRLVSIGVALLVGVLYGASMFWGLLPSAGGNISWDGHLWGAVAGIIVCRLMIRTSTRPRLIL